MGPKVIIESTSTQQIHSMCIIHRQNTTPTQLWSYRRFRLCLVTGDLCLSIAIHHTTANSQGGLKKPALQEIWGGTRQTAASQQSFYITSSQLEGC